MIGSFGLLYAILTVFIAVSPAVGYTMSTFARNQLQAMQMMVFFLLPPILRSGFAFPLRGIRLKGNGFTDLWPGVWPLIAMLFAVGTVALLRFRRTLG